LENNVATSYETSEKLNGFSRMEFYLLVFLFIGQFLAFGYTSVFLIFPLFGYELNKKRNNIFYINALDLFEELTKKKIEIFVKLPLYLFLFFFYLFTIALHFSRK
jgi:hypothetical protein